MKNQNQIPAPPLKTRQHCFQIRNRWQLFSIRGVYITCLSVEYNHSAQASPRRTRLTRSQCAAIMWSLRHMGAEQRMPEDFNHLFQS